MNHLIQIKCIKIIEDELNKHAHQIKQSLVLYKIKLKFVTFTISVQIYFSSILKYHKLRSLEVILLKIVKIIFSALKKFAIRTLKSGDVKSIKRIFFCPLFLKSQPLL